MTIKKALEIAKNELNCERKSLVSEILLAHIINKDRVFLHAHDNENLPESAQDSLFCAIKKLNSGYPLEYITKKVSFYSRTFFIDEGALIPRPETEILLQKASNLIKRHKIKHIFEIGTGSGVLGIMLCILHKDLRATCTDISLRALKIAQKNIEIQSKLISRDLSAQITLVQTNLIDGIAADENSCIISNPPYISKSYKMPPNLAFEPREALIGGVRGDEIICEIINLGAKYLCCEIGFDQKYIKKYLTSYKYVRFYRDYSSLWRGFVARKI